MRDLWILLLAFPPTHCMTQGGLLGMSALQIPQLYNRKNRMLKDKIALCKAFGSYAGKILKAQVQLYNKGHGHSRMATAAVRGWLLPGLFSWCLWRRREPALGISGRVHAYTHKEAHACVPLCTQFRLHIGGRFSKQCCCDPVHHCVLLRLLICRSVLASKRCSLILLATF